MEMLSKHNTVGPLWQSRTFFLIGKQGEAQFKNLGHSRWRSILWRAGGM